MQSTVTANVLVRDCNFIRAICDAFDTVLFIPEIEMFETWALMPRVFRNVCEMKFACDPQSSSTRHGLRKPSLLNIQLRLRA